MESTTEPGTTQVLVLNALTDVVGDSRDVLADSRSRTLIEEVFVETIDDPDAEEFRRAIRSLSDISVAEYRKREGIIDRVVDQVCESLTRRGVRIAFEHESTVEFTERQAALYSFMVSPSTDVIGGLGLSPDVEPAVNEGLELAEAGEFDRAAGRLDGVIDDGPTDGDLTTVQLLAGWTHLWAGDDPSAVDLADQVLEREGERWFAKALWIAATHTYVDQIRDGRLIVRVVLNWICDVPSGSSVDLDLRLEDGGESEWVDVDVDSGFYVLEEIAPRIAYRFRLEGTVDRFPELLGYYFGLATVYPEWHEIREIERTIHSGPETADPVERVSFRRR